MSENQPTVSVGISCYNHEAFINTVVESVLNQKRDFEIEIIAADDCSTDRTLEILKKYEASFPNVITVLASDKNLGPVNNARSIYKNCNGKYLTWLDGDDYWSHDEKLQKQVAFLEQNPDYSGCFHDAEIVHVSDENGQSKNQALGDFKFYSQFNEYRSDFHPWHLLKRNIIPTASLLFRNQTDLEKLLVHCDNSLSLNWALQLEIIKDGKFRYFNEPWSVYNDHPDGVSKKVALNDFKKANIKILERLLTDDYYVGLERDINESMAHEYLQILLNPDTEKESDKFIMDIKESYLMACEKSTAIKHL